MVGPWTQPLTRLFDEHSRHSQPDRRITITGVGTVPLSYRCFRGGPRDPRIASVLKTDDEFVSYLKTSCRWSVHNIRCDFLVDGQDTNRGFPIDLEFCKRLASGGKAVSKSHMLQSSFY